MVPVHPLLPALLSILVQVHARLGKLGEASSIVSIPEEELKVLCGVFDVDEVVHEVTGGAWLRMVESVSLVARTMP